MFPHLLGPICGGLFHVCKWEYRQDAKGGWNFHRTHQIFDGVGRTDPDIIAFFLGRFDPFQRTHH